MASQAGSARAGGGQKGAGGIKMLVSDRMVVVEESWPPLKRGDCTPVSAAVGEGTEWPPRDTAALFPEGTVLLVALDS